MSGLARRCARRNKRALRSHCPHTDTIGWVIEDRIEDCGVEGDMCLRCGKGGNKAIRRAMQCLYEDALPHSTLRIWYTATASDPLPFMFLPAPYNSPCVLVYPLRSEATIGTAADRVRARIRLYFETPKTITKLSEWLYTHKAAVAAERGGPVHVWRRGDDDVAVYDGDQCIERYTLPPEVARDDDAAVGEVLRRRLEGTR